MTLTFSLNWWTIPAIVTGIAVLYTLFYPADDGGYLGGIVRLFMAIPALIVSLLAWVIAGFFK